MDFQSRSAKRILLASIEMTPEYNYTIRISINEYSVSKDGTGKKRKIGTDLKFSIAT